MFGRGLSARQRRVGADLDGPASRRCGRGHATLAKLRQGCGVLQRTMVRWRGLILRRPGSNLRVWLAGIDAVAFGIERRVGIARYHRLWLRPRNWRHRIGGLRRGRFWRRGGGGGGGGGGWGG